MIVYDKFKGVPELALEKYKQLGRDRSLPKLRGILAHLCQTVPSLNTLKNWSAADGWQAKAHEYDEAIDQRVLGVDVDALPSSPAAVERKREHVFHAREEFSKMASSFSKRVLEWAEGDGQPTGHIKTAHDAKTMAAIALDLVRVTEVLEGRVSDRQAEEKTITKEDVVSKAKERTKENLAHAGVIALRRAQEMLGDPDLNPTVQ